MAQQDKAKKQTKPASGRGGARPGAGRKSGSGAFGEPTVPMRVPASWAPSLEERLERFKRQVADAKDASQSAAPIDWSAPAPAALGEAQPSGKPVDLCALMSRHPQSCFAWTCPKDEPELGLREGDAVVIERAATPAPGAVVAFWGERGIELSLAPKAKKALEACRPWGVAVGVARKLG